MAQYLLSVHHAPDADFGTEEEIQAMYAATGAFNDKLRDTGHWVFAGGLEGVESATTVDATGTDASRHRRPVRGVEGVPRRLLDHRGRRSRRGARPGHRGLGRLPRQGRGTPLPVRMNDLEAELTRIHREEYAAVVASLVRRFGNIDIAEDAASEALIAALEHWPTEGIPPNPGGWLTTTATRKAIDKIRRESNRDTKHQQAAMIIDPTPPADPGVVDDDRLRLLFTCCHPALAPEARVALTLKLIGGLTVEEIAAAFLVPDTTMAQRITRAKRKISDAHIPYRVPQAADLPARLGGVLAVVYLIFNEGYLSSSGEASIRDDLCLRGDPARPPAPRAGPDRARGHRPARPDAPDRGPPPGPRRRRRARHPRRAGPRPLGPRSDRRGARPGPRVPRDQPARALPAARRHQRRPHRRPRRERHRLVADRCALRPVVRRLADADRRAQPRRGDRRARRSGRRPRRGRPAGADEATTPGTRPVPTCCAGSAGATTRRRRTTRRSTATDNPAERAYLARRRGQLGPAAD